MKKPLGIYHWLPRIICILTIGFISLFALDAFQEHTGLGKQLLDFTIHLIPTFILIGLLIIAWKWEKIGGIVFLVMGLVFSPLVYIGNYDINQSVGMSLGIVATITLPFILVGVLFLLSHYKKKHNG